MKKILSYILFGIFFGISSYVIGNSFTNCTWNLANASFDVVQHNGDCDGHDGEYIYVRGEIDCTDGNSLGCANGLSLGFLIEQRNIFMGMYYYTVYNINCMAVAGNQCHFTYHPGLCVSLDGLPTGHYRGTPVFVLGSCLDSNIVRQGSSFCFYWNNSTKTYTSETCL